VAAGNDLPKKQSPRIAEAASRRSESPKPPAGGFSAAESPKPPAGEAAGRQSPAQSQPKKALDEKHISSGRV
jgi:hypothetical protein